MSPFGKDLLETLGNFASLVSVYRRTEAEIRGEIRRSPENFALVVERVGRITLDSKSASSTLITLICSCESIYRG